MRYKSPRSRTPRRVEIGGKLFDVRHRNSAEDFIGTRGIGRALLGRMEHDAGFMELARSSDGLPISSDCFTDTFLHECIHGLASVGGELFSDGDIEEAFIDAFAPRLLDFLRRNKAAVAWLQRRD